MARRVRCRLGRPDARGRGDILDFGNGGSNVAISFSAALLVFTVLVTAAGWLLPSRVLSGVLVGTISVVGNLVILVALGFVASLEAAFSGLDGVRQVVVRGTTSANAAR